ncbi:MAG: SIS domain-containing protein [Actinomycetota bacterium]|nr:SIS domain-containing protein [Actinomycetota bacterium]
MIPDLFMRDLEAKPDVLLELAGHLTSVDPWAGTGITADSRLVLLGMGSSHYANCVAAARLRARGHEAVAELASSDLLPTARPGTVVVAVSASGGSAETVAALGRYAGRAPIIAMTNVEGSPITEHATTVVPMLARPELGGVACRSFQHTLALLLDLESRLSGEAGAGTTVRGAATASADLLERRAHWLPALTEVAIGPDGTHLVAPARRLSSAQQGALMLREGPRLPAIGCETGDWSHVDVYLTKTTDYRLILFRGSLWEPELLRWVRERGSTMACVGDGVDEARVTVRFRGDDEDDVRLLAEVLVPELLAASLWS